MHGDEKSLIKRAKRYDRAAIGELYRRNVQRVFRYIYYRVGDEQTAEDLTSEVFLKALEGIKRFTFRGVPFSAWLYRIAHARVVDHFRRQAMKDHVPIEGESILVWEKGFDAGFRRQELAAAIAQLTTDQQQVIILKFIEGMSNTEVARILGKSEGAVKSLQHRALASLRRVMEKEA